MNKNLADINLNLLLALDALFKEKNVTNAGKRLSITQSAMSNTLKQLRDIFRDELFIRGHGKRLIPTSYALSIETRVTEAIEKLALVFKQPEAFDPKSAAVTFTIGLSDYTEYLFLPKLVKHLLKDAPNINLVIKHMTYIQNKHHFENDDIDIALGIFLNLPETLIAQPLYSETIVCMGAKDNPLLKKPLSKKEFAEAKQLIVMYTESRTQMYTERMVQEMGCHRRAVVTVPNALPALNAVIDTDLIAVVMGRIAKKYCSNQSLISQGFDFEVPKPQVSMVWHPKHKNNLGHQWLRNLILDIAKTV